jgi:uncharacterized protein YjbJ (UPF0337 family)
MNWDEIEENWKLFNGKVRSHWGKLTDDDVELANGKRGELLGLVTIEKVTYPDRLNAESHHRHQFGACGRALPRKASPDTWWLKVGPMLEYRVSVRRIG